MTHLPRAPRLLIVLLLANLGVALWLSGALSGLVEPPGQAEREPQRSGQQIAPDSLRVLPPSAAQPRRAAPACLEAGPFSAAELPQAEAVLQQLMPEGGWSMISRERPGSWMVYMGRYTSRATMEKRAEELRKREVAFEEVRDLPDYEPGFVFGRYTSEADAQAARQRLVAQRIRFLRVVRLEAPSVSHLLRIPRADAELQARAAEAGELARGRPLRPCGKGG